MTKPVHSALSYAQANQDQFLEDLIVFTSIPSISTDPDYCMDIKAAATWVSKKLESLGIESVQLYPTKGHPIVYGQYLHAGDESPTVLIYGHYDVQPAEPLQEWNTDPFTPEIQQENVYARGISDMKGQIIAVLSAVESIMNTTRLPVNLKFLIEGEEEIGSPNLTPFIKDHRNLLACDFVLNADTGMISPDLPTITYALRGLAYFEIHLWGPAQDLHSGVFGGTVHNPAQALSEVIAGMHDENCRVTLPGFYDQVLPLNEEERAEISRLPRNESWYLKNTGVPALWGEPEYTPDERVGGRPTIEVHGLKSGFSGEGAKTVLPAHAMAKISSRLVPNQDPEQIHQSLLKYCKKTIPPSINWEVKYLNGGKPSISDQNSPWVQAYYKAAETVWQVSPAFKREGGSVPVVSDFQEILNAESVNIGFGLPSDNMHGPNERLHLPTWKKGIKALIIFFNNLGNLS
jgi:acetylornithine deacetylase/succinyl-diaminopimelate desuccinylase-like protein